MTSRHRIPFLFAALVACPLTPLFAQTASVESGAWSDNDTWGGTPPASVHATITAGHTVNADVNISSAASGDRLSIYGTLNVGEGASLITSGRINNNITTSGTLNLTGGVIHVQLMGNNGASGAAVVDNFTLNLSAGSFSTNEGLIGYATTINLSGGTFNSGGGGFYTGNTVLNLTGGAYVFTNGYTGSFNGAMGRGSWNGGRVVTNTSGSVNNSGLNNLIDPLSTNAANVWDLSDKTTKQTFTGTANAAYSVTNGIVEFDVYSASANDSDQIVMNGGASARINFSSSVVFAIEGADLSGEATDYLGVTYKLLDYSSDNYSGVQATIASTIWNIGGADYEVTFTNNLATAGTVTVSELTLALVPEPSSAALLFGLGGLGFAALRRRR